MYVSRSTFAFSNSAQQHSKVTQNCYNSINSTKFIQLNATQRNSCNIIRLHATQQEIIFHFGTELFRIELYPDEESVDQICELKQIVEYSKL